MTGTERRLSDALRADRVTVATQGHATVPEFGPVLLFAAIVTENGVTTMELLALSDSDGHLWRMRQPGQAKFKTREPALLDAWRIMAECENGEIPKDAAMAALLRMRPSEFRLANLVTAVVAYAFAPEEKTKRNDPDPDHH